MKGWTAVSETKAIDLLKDLKQFGGELFELLDNVVEVFPALDFAGAADSMAKNLDLEFTRNRERYQFMKWGMQAYRTFRVVPPIGRSASMMCWVAV